VRLNREILRRLSSLVKNVIDSVAVKGTGVATNVTQSVVNLTIPFVFFHPQAAGHGKEVSSKQFEFPGLFRRLHEHRQRPWECPEYSEVSKSPVPEGEGC
jgi:hypothetical protein